MKFIAAFLVLYISCSSVLGQSISVKSCPNRAAQQNFNLPQFTGKWYEHSRYFTAQDVGTKCMVTQFEDKGNGAFSVVRSYMKLMGANVETLSGSGVLAGSSGDGTLKFTIPSRASPQTPTTTVYKVLETDYSNYAVLWSCTDKQYFNMQYAWILTRVRQPSQDIVNKARAVFDKNSLPKVLLSQTNQNNCKN